MKVNIISGKYKGRIGILQDKIDTENYEVRLFSKNNTLKYSRVVIVNRKDIK